MIRHIIYFKDNSIIDTYNISDIKYKNWHREDGPANILYHENGNINREVYYVNDKKHRLDGPGDIIYDENGNIIRESYYINDKYYTKENYYKEIFRLKLKSL